MSIVWAATEWVLPLDLDPECSYLCIAMNKMPGIATIESCCGHEKEPFRVWFQADDLASLPPLLYWFDGCHSGHYGWRVEVTTDCGMAPATFCVVGPVGGFGEADEIAELMQAR